MKVSKGRGIQFFKHPVFTVPRNFAVKAFYDSKKNFSGLIKFGKKK